MAQREAAAAPSKPTKPTPATGTAAPPAASAGVRASKRILRLPEALAHELGHFDEGPVGAPRVPASIRRKRLAQVPWLSEVEAVRHYTRLSRLNYGIDGGMYPLGSCTMKYNPKFCEDVARMPGAARIHPLQEPATVQGALRILWELAEGLKEVTGMDAVTLQPAAGAAGEFTGLLVAKAFHESRGESHRDEVIVPDTAHGTNPATAGMLGYKVVEVPSTKDGTVDVEALKSVVGARTAALMLTNPSTLGIFESDIVAVAKVIHGAGGLLYYDGANLNAIMGKAKPGEMGFDIVHMNLHKTFATPHGGGGPGAGPVAVKARLAEFLPLPRVEREGDGDAATYRWVASNGRSVGRVHGWHGNFGMLVRAYAYLVRHGGDGLQAISEIAVLNSNYLFRKVKDLFEAPHKPLKKHEFVVSAANVKREKGIRTTDIAKRLLDKGFHAPTVYFPLIVEEALMIEPTETEPRRELDRFARALREILAEDPELVHGAPHTTPVGRLDEVSAARHLVLNWPQAEAYAAASVGEAGGSEAPTERGAGAEPAGEAKRADGRPGSRP